MDSRNKTVSCAVAICDSPNNAIYHHFPKDPLRRSKWESACHRKDPLGKYPRICENHFEEKDYKRDLKGELLGTLLKRKLKEDAIPSRGIIPREEFEQAPRKRKRIKIVEHFEQDSNQIYKKNRMNETESRSSGLKNKNDNLLFKTSIESEETRNQRFQEERKHHSQASAQESNKTRNLTLPICEIFVKGHI
uniref:THAP domaincontaining protein 4like [Acyrthosiphon pisum] n=1 Tax=Lepeophtheirus salmonis TaxID=72036 RepID=A0A0K2UFB4_LEPSM